MTHDEILQAVAVERAAQHTKWGGPHEWGWGDCSSDNVPMIVKAAVLAEEAGEVVQAVLNAGPDKAYEDPDVRREVVQALAVAFAILEAM